MEYKLYLNTVMKIKSRFAWIYYKRRKKRWRITCYIMHKRRIKQKNIKKNASNCGTKGCWRYTTKKNDTKWVNAHQFFNKDRTKRLVFFFFATLHDSQARAILISICASMYKKFWHSMWTHTLFLIQCSHEFSLMYFSIYFLCI